MCSLQSHLAPPTPPNHLYDCRVTLPSITMSVCHATSPSIIPPAPSVCQPTCPHVELSVRHMDMSICHTTSPSVCQSPHKSAALSICNTASPSVIPVHMSYNQSIHYPVNLSMTCQSVTPPISPMIHLSDHPARPSVRPTTQSIRPSVNAQLSVRRPTQSVSMSVTI